MRKALPIVVAAAIVGVSLQAIGGAPGRIAENKMTGLPIQNGVSVYGLHVALPENMTNFSKELVPLP
jgi:hypothetical protein